MFGKVRRSLAELPPVLTDILIPEGINNYGNCIGFVSMWVKASVQDAFPGTLAPDVDVENLLIDSSQG